PVLQLVAEAAARDAALVGDVGAHCGVSRRSADDREDRRGGGGRRGCAASRARACAPACARDADARRPHRGGGAGRRAGAGAALPARGAPAVAAAPHLALGSEERRMKPAVVLLSGGLDSTTCLAWARAQGFACHTLAVDYGQRHAVELESARRVA